jgi:hypothetical protein
MPEAEEENNQVQHSTFEVQDIDNQLDNWYPLF